MSKQNKWNILNEDAAVMTLTYDFAPSAEATSFAARMENGQMMIVSSATEPDDAVIDEIKSYGDVGAIVICNGMHYMGVSAWKDRFPGAHIYAPSASMERVTKKLPTLQNIEHLSALRDIAGSQIGFSEVADSKIGESWFWISTPKGYIWFVSDVLINLPELPKKFFPRILFKLTGCAPGYRIFNMMLLMTVKNKKETLRTFLDDLTKHPPYTIIPGHGDILTGDRISEKTKNLISHAL